MTAGTDLTALNTLQLNAEAQHLVTITSSDHLRAEIAALDEGAVPHVLGGGSNVILCDHLSGTTLLMAIKGREVLSDDGTDSNHHFGAVVAQYFAALYGHEQRRSGQVIAENHITAPTQHMGHRALFQGGDLRPQLI